MKDFNEIWAKTQQYNIQQVKEEFMCMLTVLPENARGIEIGCATGGSTVGFSMICSKLVSVDIKKNFDTTEVEKNCKYKLIVGNSFDPEIIKEVESQFRKPVDFLFIDGEHSSVGSKADYDNYKHLVKPGGFIFFHDIVDSDWHKQQRCYVYKTWNKVKLDHEYEEFIFEGSWGGIGMLVV